MALTSDLITIYRVEVLPPQDQKLIESKSIIYPIGGLIFNTNAVISIEPSNLFPAEYRTRAEYTKEIKDLKTRATEEAIKNNESDKAEKAPVRDGEVPSKSSYYYMNTSSGARYIIDADGLTSLQSV